MTIGKAIKFINELTDVIPDDCSDSEICKKALQMAITALQNQPVWIPVSERLPEESGEYLTWVRYDNEEFMSIEEIECEGILKEWNFTGKVLYWMPLPKEPYRESEEENGKV